jgi:hypothetical protein
VFSQAASTPVAWCHPVGVPGDERIKESSMENVHERMTTAFWMVLRLTAAAVIVGLLSYAAFGREASRDLKVERVSFPVTHSDGNTYNIPEGE